MRAIVWCVFLGACGLSEPDVQIQPGDNIRLDDGVNGSVGCDRGTLYLPSNAVINGSLDGTDCVLKIEGTINGPITARGGVLHVFGVHTVNGPLDVSDAVEVYIADSGFNGDGDVTSNGTVVVMGSRFNGSLTIRNNKSCTAGNNSTNGSLVESNCARP